LFGVDSSMIGCSPDVLIDLIWTGVSDDMTMRHS
jgi:hypothetical protein